MIAMLTLALTCLAMCVLLAALSSLQAVAQHLAVIKGAMQRIAEATEQSVVVSTKSAAVADEMAHVVIRTEAEAVPLMRGRTTES